MELDYDCLTEPTSDTCQFFHSEAILSVSNWVLLDILLLEYRRKGRQLANAE